MGTVRRTAGFGGLLAMTVAGCAPSASSYRRNAEEFIRSEQFLEQAAGQVTSRLTEATCTDPATTDAGTTFGCTAADAAGVKYQIGVRIVAADEMEFEVTRA